MTQKQRFLTALKRGIPDVVPVSPLIHCRYAHARYGRSDWRAVFELHREIGSCHYRGPIGIDYETDPVPGYEWTHETVVDDPPHRVERSILHTPAGDLTRVVDWGSIPHDPLVSKTIEYPVKTPEQWEPIIRLWEKQAETARPCRSELVEEVVRVMGEDGVPSVGIGSAFSMVAEQRGMQQFMYDLFDYPDLIQRALEAARYLTEVAVDSFLLTSSEFLYYDICWSTGMNLGPETYEKWMAEELGRVCDKVRSAGRYISFYTLGRMRKITPILVDAGPHMIASFEPNEGDLSLREAKQLYGDRICVMGNFDCVVLARGTLEEARAEARRCLDEAMEGGGYIMGTADEVPADTRFENLKAMVEVAEEYGRYD